MLFDITRAWPRNSVHRTSDGRTNKIIKTYPPYPKDTGILSLPYSSPSGATRGLKSSSSPSQILP